MFKFLYNKKENDEKENNDNVPDMNANEKYETKSVLIGNHYNVQYYPDATYLTHLNTQNKTFLIMLASMGLLVFVAKRITQ